jgi:hypothetical protein
MPYTIARPGLPPNYVPHVKLEVKYLFLLEEKRELLV